MLRNLIEAMYRYIIMRIATAVEPAAIDAELYRHSMQVSNAVRQAH